VVLTHVAFATIVLSSDFGSPPQGIWSILAAGQVGAIGPFFLMSGMLLYRPFARAAIVGTQKPALRPFFIRRAARLLPAVWLLVTFCLLVLNLSSIDGLWYVLRPYLLLHYYDFSFYAGLDVTWTVPTETQFYLALPVMAWIMGRLARTASDPAQRARRMLAPLGVLIAVQFVWTAYIHGTLGPWPPEFFWPFSISGLFAIGMALAIWLVLAEVDPGRPPGLFRAAVKRPNLFWLGALAAYAINCAQPFSTPGTADWLSPAAALVRHAMLLSFSFLIMVPLVVPGASSRLMESLLSNPPMRYLGRISYGIYLWHFAAMYLVFQTGSVFGESPTPVGFLLGQFGFWELMVPTVLLTIAFATVSFFLLERPVIRLGDRVIRSRWGAFPVAVGAGSPPPVRSPVEPAGNRPTTGT
jgi:peptidoglycan/LPS O-acetylase OafA/YrhL